MSDHHELPIKTPKQLIIAIVLAFVVPVVVIILLTRYVGESSKPAAGSNLMTPEATAARIAPVGRLTLEATAAAASADAPAATDATDAAIVKVRTGAEVYQAKCMGCHAAGVLGSPKFGDASAWSGRIGAGLEALTTASLKGKGKMPPQAGGGYSDEEIRRAVAYLANSAGASFPTE